MTIKLKIIIANFCLLVALFFILISKSPFMMCLSLIFSVTVLGTLMHFLGSMWLMYTLIIMFLGGMMIVFVYASSVNNNFKVFTSYTSALMGSLIFSCSVWWVAQPETFLSQGQSAVWIFSTSSSYSYISFLAFTILLSLFIIVKVVQVEQGPLKM